MRDNHDQLDRLLDSALATYADPGSESGLERRILSRIAAEATPPPRRRWLPWAIALPAAASLLLFFLLSHSATNRQPVNPDHAHVSSQPPASSDRQVAERHGNELHQGTGSVTPKKKPAERRTLAAERTRHRGRIALAAESTPLPKLDVFPTPQPPTPQERALAQFAAHTPQPVQEALARSLQQQVPLTVPSVRTLAVPTIHVSPVPSLPALSFESPDAIHLGPPSEDEN